MPKITREEFEEAMSRVHIRIDGCDVFLNGAPICIAVSLIDALKKVLESSCDEEEKFIIRSLITQAFAEGFVDDEE